MDAPPGPAAPTHGRVREPTLLGLLGVSASTGHRDQAAGDDLVVADNVGAHARGEGPEDQTALAHQQPFVTDVEQRHCDQEREGHRWRYRLEEGLTGIDG